MRSTLHEKAFGKLKRTSTIAGVGANNKNNRLSVTDLQSGERFLIDTGAEISVLAARPRRRTVPTAYKLYAANGTAIRTYGEKELILNLGLRRPYKWTFIIADIGRSILGADFLRQHRLLVDLRRGKLIDGVTDLSINALTVRDSMSIHMMK